MRRLLLGVVLISGACASSKTTAPATVRITHTPRSYEIVYRVDAGDAVSTQRVSVRRPFDGRVADRPGAPPGQGEETVSVSSFGRLLLTAGGSQAGLVAQPPAPALGDLRPGIGLDAALAAHVVAATGRDTIAGRPCQRYRAGGPPGAGRLARYRTGAPSYVELCVDADGLVLDQRTVDHGKQIRRQTAVSVVVDPALADSLFATPGEPAPVRSGGGSVQELTHDSRTPGKFWELAQPPAGFALRGRYAVVPPQSGFSEAGKESARTAGVSDVYVHGADVLIVDRGGTLGGVPAFEPDTTATTVDAGALGTAELLIGLVTNEVRVAMPGGHYVRVVGTVPPEMLLAAARALREVPGGQLTVVTSPG